MNRNAAAKRRSSAAEKKRLRARMASRFSWYRYREASHHPEDIKNSRRPPSDASLFFGPGSIMEVLENVRSIAGRKPAKRK